MENQDFRISLWTVWVLVVIADLMIIYGIYVKLSQNEASSFFLTSGFILSISILIILVNDIIKNKVYNKTFWLMAMIIMTPITSVYYLLQRDKLIHLGQQEL